MTPRATNEARVAIYGRTSTAHQTVENQLLELREYVTARGWTAAEYSDQSAAPPTGDPDWTR